jgi:hypothetical protein
MLKNLSDIDKEFDSLVNKAVDQRAEQLKVNLMLNTPVDTGRARDGWKTQQTSNGVIISNDVEYIGALNEGHSQQAPPYFIERTAVQYGKPVGAIVRKVNE